MKFTQQILGFSWQGEEKDLKPFCRLRNLLDDKITNLDLTLPYHFNWVLSDEYFCPGYTDEHRVRHTCPQESKIEPKYDRCAYCSAKDGFKQAFFFGGEVNARMEKHLSQDHYLYLAFFHPRHIKVGTAAAPRKYKRLIEQDALISTFIAHMPGNKIQTLERYVSKTFNIPESIRQRQKLNILKIHPNYKVAHELLQSIAQKVDNHLSATKFANNLISKAEREIIDFTKNPHIYYPKVETQLHSIDNPNKLAGVFKGLRGRTLIVENSNRTYTFNTKELINRHLAISEKSLSLCPELGQTSLFA